MAFAPERFIDRAPELDLFRRALNGATDGRGSVILVGGARGIGKTTLLQRLRILVEGEGDAGGLFEFVVPQFAPDEPYTPFIKLLWEVGERDPALGHIVADAAPRWASPEGRLAVEDVRLHDDFAHAMAALAAKRRPFVVAVDDVGDLDPQSVALLHHLADRAPRDGYVLAIAGDEATEPLRTLHERLGSARDTIVMGIGGWTPDVIRELLEPAFGGSVPDDVATMLTDRTEGRPWQTLEAIDLLAKSGVLDQPASEHIPDEIAAAVDEAAKAAERAAPTFLKAGYLTDAVAMDAEVTDEIGVHADVDALARLMVDRDVHPPLSIGLFGDWGSGKSYFMRLMQQRVEKLAGSSARVPDGGAAYCTKVRQITFNAWHYADDNLWASLIGRIFQGLGEPAAVSQIAQRLVESGKAPPGGVLNYMGQRRLQAQARLGEGQRDKESAEARLETLSPAAQRALPALQAISAASGIAKDPAIVAAQARLKESFGPEAADRAREADEATNALSRLGSDLQLLWSLLRDGHGTRRRVAIAGGVTLASLVLVLSVLAVLEPAWIRGLTAAVIAASAIVTLFARGARAAVTNEARAAAEQASAEARAQREQAQQKIAAANAEIEALDAGSATSEYLLDRAAEFRSRQGLIALIREELEQLGSALVDRDGGTERVVLYIDDLDRCGTRRVVQVLEAVHLLLAFPLFVVVVGVDARWLLSALRHHYRAQFSGGIAAATPQQYLEKIFQIPFAIQPIGTEGFGRLMKSMLQPSPAMTSTVAAPPEEEIAHSQTAATPAPPSPPSAGAAAPELPPAEEREQLDDSAVGEQLQVSPAELEFASALQPIVRSPRAAKRLVNLYRIIRTSSAGAGQVQQVDHDFRGILLLLALLVASPNEAVRVFEAVRSSGDASSMAALIGGLREATDGEDEALRSMEDLIRAHDQLDDVDVYRRWLPNVARFSFETALRG